MYSGTGTGGALLQTLTPTRTGATWTTTAAALAQGTYTAQAAQTDTVGNTGTSSANTFTVDTTAPTLASVQAFNGKVLGKIDSVGSNKDTLTFTYADSNGVAPGSIVAGWDGTGTRSVNVTFTNGGAANDSITVPGIGTVNLGSTAWLTATSSQNDTLTMVAPNTFIITIDFDPSGNANGIAASNFTWTAAGGTATDAAGNAATGSVPTNGQRF